MTLESKSIHEKLFKIQQEIGGIQKTSTNPFFKSKYFDINALIEQLQPMLKEQGLLLLQPLICNEYEQNGVETQLIEVKTGSMVTSFAQLPDLTDPQKMGSAITYLRRYTLQSLLGLQAADDDANKASGKSYPMEDWQSQKIDSLLHTATIEEKDREYIENNIKEYDKTRANEAIKYLEDNQKKSITKEFEDRIDREK